jgi:DNA-binding IclR family transcriptional regulator
MAAPTGRGRPPAGAEDRSMTGRQPGAIAHALDALEAVAQLGPGATAKQVSQLLALSPATTYRLLNLLVAEEYIVRLPDLSGFALGRRALEFAGIAAPPRLTLSREARRALARLRSDLRWGVHLAAYSHGRVHLVDPDPDHPPHDESLTGDDFEQSAVGRLVAATDDIAYDRGLIESGVACIAAAIRDEDGHLLAALVVMGPLERLTSVEADLEVRLRAASAELGDLMA